MRTADSTVPTGPCASFIERTLASPLHGRGPDTSVEPCEVVRDRKAHTAVLDRPGFDVGVIMCMPQLFGQPLVVDCTRRVLQGAYAPSTNDASGACCTSR